MIKNNFVNWTHHTKEIVICLTLNLDIVEFNPIAEKIFNWKQAEVLGKNYLMLCAAHNIIPPFSSNLAEILESKTSIHIENTLYEDKYILSWKITRTLDNNHIPYGYLLIAEDITQLRHTEAELRQLEENTRWTNHALASLNQSVTGQALNKKIPTIEYAKDIYDYMENIIAAMPCIVWWMDRQGTYLGCNNNYANLFGLKSRQDVVGKTYEDLYDKMNGDFYRAVDTEVMNTGIPQILEEPVYEPDGIKKSIYISNKVPLFDATGNVIGMVGISYDVTQRKEEERILKESKEKAEAANVAKSEFLAVISHEFRIPLTGILGMAKLMSMQNLSPEKQKEYVQHISSAGMHLLNLINDTLDFSKLEAGKFELACAPIDLNVLIEETCTMLTPLSKAKNLELFIHFDQTTSYQILGDKRALRQIIINLAGNAIKFTERGHVSIEVKNIGETPDTVKLVISVSDTGIGIPADKKEMIFEHFTQVDASHSRRYGGAGLGLSITKKLVELLNGTISVNSQIEKGSTFHCVFEFPRQTETTIMSSPWAAYLSTTRILIVDDTLRGEVIRKQLSPSNSQVISGKEALNTLLASYQIEDPYDIVIIDQGLLNTNPFELAKNIRKHNELHQPMLVILTDDGCINTKENAKAAGYFESFVKPIQPLALQIALTATWEKWIEQKSCALV